MKIERPRQLFNIVEVTWDDAAELEPGWVSGDVEIEPHYALSVGFLIQETKEEIVLAQDLDREGSHNGRGRIPRGMVKRIKVLRKKDV